MRLRPTAHARNRGAALAAALALVPACGGAAELSVEITDVRGRAAPDGVVELNPAGVAAPARFAPQQRVIDQKNEMFVPYVEVFRPGDSVVFSNSDETRHHVYSFSPAKRFEFVLASGERSPPQRLDASGSIAVGCNIHDHMVSYLHVTEARWVARADAQGRVRLVDLPPGEYTLRIWHPQLRPGATPAPRSVVLDSDRARQHSSFALPLLPDPRGERDLEQVDY
jgi:plastocyanin